MHILRKLGSTSNMLRIMLRNASTGQGLTGLAHDTSGLIISTIADNEAAATAYTVAGSTIETISTLATFAAPTATKCRFKEVDATNHPGLYELQFADARFAVASAKCLRITITGAANLLDKEITVQLTSVDVDSATAFVTSVVAASVTAGVTLAANQHVITDSGTVTTVSGNVNGTVGSVVTKTGYELAADQAVNVTKIAGAAVNTALAQLGVNVVSQDNIDFGATQKASITTAVPTAAQAAAAVLAATVDTLTVSKLLQALLAVLANKAAVSGDTISFKDVAGTTEVVSVTCGSTAGERTASTVT